LLFMAMETAVAETLAAFAISFMVAFFLTSLTFPILLMTGEN